MFLAQMQFIIVRLSLLSLEASASEAVASFTILSMVSIDALRIFEVILLRAAVTDCCAVLLFHACLLMTMERERRENVEMRAVV